MSYRDSSFAAVSMLAMLTCAAPASAHVGPHEHGMAASAMKIEVRNWTMADGTTLVGSFLSADESRVRIECDDGSTAALERSELDAASLAWIEAAEGALASLNMVGPAPRLAWPQEEADSTNLPYDAFAPEVRTRRDERWLYVESRGWPAHPMMAGIRTWQQQVPLPQPYTGDNAWRIPLAPKLADKPVSGKTALMRGAIALAANGVPIFNALNNRGEDAYKIGELDKWGGHCGRSDDYHYHAAPLHLLEMLGKDSPLGHALDGFPLYGLFDPKKPETCPLGATDKLDELNGHAKQGGLYHYHSSLEYPYINGGVRGVVQVVGDQIDPQPRAAGVREALQALRGAAIVEHKATGTDAWSVRYTLDKAEHRVDYKKLEDGRWQFDFVSPDGTKRTETYPAQRLGGGGEGQGGGQGRRAGGQGGGRRGEGRPAEGTTPQLPWILAHATEIDADGDGKLGRQEILTQAQAAFDAFDANKDGTLDAKEQSARPPRLAMGGFIGLHAKELDEDGDGAIARAELLAVSTRMHAKSDLDGDGTIAGEELTAPARQQRGQGGQGRQGGTRVEEDFHDEIPEHPWDIVLARPGATDMTISVLSWSEVEGRIEHAPAAGGKPVTSAAAKLVPQKAHAFVLQGLQPDTEYSYRWQWREGAGEWKSSEPFRFHTQRPPGAPYRYAIFADSHLDSNADTATFGWTLANALADKPDFLVDLGDTFMVDKRREFRQSRPQFFAQRYWFGQIGHSTPLFMLLGNHDGERGYQADGPESMAVWSHELRTNLFPSPVPGGIYTGNTDEHPLVGDMQNYYAWHWGDALHIVLDPFWYTTVRGRGDGGDNWARTLGRKQYDWLEATLANSKAKYVFVYIHHLVGGRGRDARGGVESAGWYEWGGKGEDGVEAFATQRPGWKQPIHALLVEHKVAAVFHGHDHLYVHNQLDGVVYQCVPQPGNTRGGTNSAAQYGYTSGVILGSPGALRVSVGPDETKVEFVRSAERARRAGDAKQTTIVDHSWTVKPRQLQPTTGAGR